MRHVMTHRYTVSPDSFSCAHYLSGVDDSAASVAAFRARMVNRPHIAVPSMSDAHAPVIFLARAL